MRTSERRTRGVECFAEVGTSWQEASRRSKVVIYGCSERELEVSWCERRGCRGQFALDGQNKLSQLEIVVLSVKLFSLYHSELVESVNFITVMSVH